jgi:U3 small nucleolar RNA-associated protein 19
VQHDSAEVQVAALLSVLEFTRRAATVSAGAGSVGGEPVSTELTELLALVFSRLACLPAVSDALLEVVKHEMFRATGRVRSLRAVVRAIGQARRDAASGVEVEDQAEIFVTLLALVGDMPNDAASLADQTAGGEGDDDDDQSSDSGSESEPEDGASARKRKRAKKTPATSASERQLTRHRRAFESAWLACLKLPMRPQTYKRVLLRLPEYVMPHLPSPLKLSDFLTDSYNLGGLTSVLALSGLFILMRCHNLDYPRFYESLYATLTPAVFYSKHRARYFRLLNLCLSSANLPVYVVAAFLKKLNRLALGAPPSGAMYVLALTKNLLQKHGAAMPLIRKKAATADEGPAADRFDATASSPVASRALESSLWELHALKAHYHPGVSVLCKELERKWDKHEAKLPMHEYTSQTYRQLYDLEAQRKTKTTPLCFQKPAGGLWGGDFHNGIFSADA